MYKNIKADNLSEFITGLGNLSDSDFEDFLNEVENSELKLDSEIDAILNATGLENLQISELVELCERDEMKFMEKYSKLEELNCAACQVRKELDSSVHSVLKAYVGFHPDFKDTEYIHFDEWNVVIGASGWTSIIIFFDYRGSEYSQMFPIECFDSLEERDKFIRETVNDILKERELGDKIKQQEIVRKERKLLAELRAKYGDS